MRLFVEQMVLKSPRVWLSSVTTKATAWASWCSFNERCLSEDHICKLLYKITVFHEFIKQSLFWNGWGVVPISAAQNRHLFELKLAVVGNNSKHMTGSPPPPPIFFFWVVFPLYDRQVCVCTQRAQYIQKERCWIMSFKINFSLGLSELIQTRQVTYLANWVARKVWQDIPKRSLSRLRFFEAIQEEASR